MRFVSIASGSSGNCIYAGTESTHILVDVLPFHIDHDAAGPCGLPDPVWK